MRAEDRLGVQYVDHANYNQDHTSNLVYNHHQDQHEQYQSRDFNGVSGILSGAGNLAHHGTSDQHPALSQLYNLDTSDCFKKYLCELSETSPVNLLSEEEALVAMMTSQAPQVHLRDLLTTTRHRVRRSAVNMREAEMVSARCGSQFPRCAVSRIDILKVYREQKTAFCETPLPYGLTGSARPLSLRGI